MYFKWYLKGLDDPSLKKLFQFLTGSDVVAVEKIDIAYYKPDNEFFGRPISYKCGPFIELPTTYNSFCELGEKTLYIESFTKKLVGSRYCLMIWLLEQSALLTLTV